MSNYNTHKNTIEFKVYGKYALFTDPITKVGGEKCSYQVPTYEAIKGIAESIYWKPTFIWIIDKVRVMKSIEMETKGIRTLKYRGGNGLYYYTYLKGVEYQVQAHFQWNNTISGLQKDRELDKIDGKHFAIAKRSVEKGGRRDIFLGTRECYGYVEPCSFGEDKSDYDGKELLFGMMFHSFGYPNETGKSELMRRIWQAKMKNGIIDFSDKKEQEKILVESIKPIQQKEVWTLNSNVRSFDDEYRELFANDGEDIL
jgi:CRISPR-associated protein Cas5d